MQPLEIAASVFTLICVVLGVKRSLWQFPFGVVGTSLFFFVFWNAQLYASMALQVFFLAVQFYGWWYWLRGDEGKQPPVRLAGWPLTLGLCAAALVAAGLGAWALDAFTDAQLPIFDALIFGLSIAAQFLLSRKLVETWPVWVVVNVLAVGVYSSQQLWAPAALYVFFFFNAFWGWWEWRRAMKRDRPAEGNRRPSGSERWRREDSARKKAGKSWSGSRRRRRPRCRP